jgi:hypothetical protein
MSERPALAGRRLIPEGGVSRLSGIQARVATRAFFVGLATAAEAVSHAVDTRF